MKFAVPWKLLGSSALFISLQFIYQVTCLHCFQCNNDIGSCNDGQCNGIGCVKIQATNQDISSVQKGCTIMQEMPRCLKTDMVGVKVQRCVCTYDWCNGDSELIKSGLQEGDDVTSAASDRNKRTDNKQWASALAISTNYLIMLVFLCLFVTGSFSLLIFNTVCVHLM